MPDQCMCLVVCGTRDPCATQRNMDRDQTQNWKVLDKQVLAQRRTTLTKRMMDTDEMYDLKC